MSGHSKWATTKHKKAAIDAKRSSLFSKLSRNITVAAKIGGDPNPDNNATLAAAVQRARMVSMPNAKIKAAIDKAFGAGADAVDYKLINLCHKGDIVVSQDYGVAAMALGKGAYAIHQSGKWYTDANIDQMLMERHLNKKARRSSGKNHMKGPRKRTEEDDIRFAESFEKLVLKGKTWNLQ